MAMRERRKDHFGIGIKKKAKGERRKGHLARRRRVGRWEEISHLDKIGEREGEKEKKKKNEGRRKIGDKKNKKGEEGKREFPVFQW